MTHTRRDQLVSQGKKSFEKKDYRHAKLFFSEALEADDQSIEAYFYLATIYQIEGELGKAIKLFTKVLELNPNHTDASISLSVLYNDIGQYEQAKRVFEQARERVVNCASTGDEQDRHINRQFAARHFEIAELYMSFNRYDEALFEYNKASQLDPEKGEYRIKEAQAYAKKGYLNKAVQGLVNLINERPDFVAARVALGLVYYSAGKILEAQGEWEKTLLRDPLNIEAANYLNFARAATEIQL